MRNAGGSRFSGASGDALARGAGVAVERRGAAVERVEVDRVGEALADGVGAGNGAPDARAAIDSQVKLPPGTYLEWGGQFENLASARDRLAIVVPICFAVIMLLLYGALGSVRDALIVFTGVPLALVGGVLALVLRGMPFSISAAVGFIALSGGIGTFEELFEVWTWAQLGDHAKPVSLLNVDGFYDPLVTFLDSVVRKGFLKAEHRDMLIVASDPDDLLTRLAHYRPPPLGKWIGDTER